MNWITLIIHVWQDWLVTGLQAPYVSLVLVPHGPKATGLPSKLSRPQSDQTHMGWTGQRIPIHRGPTHPTISIQETFWRQIPQETTSGLVKPCARGLRGNPQPTVGCFHFISRWIQTFGPPCKSKLQVDLSVMILRPIDCRCHNVPNSNHTIACTKISIIHLLKLNQ